MRRAVEDLVRSQIAGAELDRGPRTGVLSDFIEAETRQADTRVESAPDVVVEDDLDPVFRQVLNEAWERTA